MFLLMAPRRNNNSGGILVQQQQIQQQQQAHIQHYTSQQIHQQYQQQFYQQQQQEERFLYESSSLNNNNIIMPTTNTVVATVPAARTPVANINITTDSANNGNHHINHNNSEHFVQCCYPNGECCKIDALIALDDLSDCIRVICNSENCTVSSYMHRECFEAFEQSVLVYFKTVGRGRTWTERQRVQNLWTRKGFDIVYKACMCKCGRGQIRKDTEWSPPKPQRAMANGGTGNSTITTVNDDEDKKKKKKRNRNSQKQQAQLSNGQSQQLAHAQESPQKAPQPHQNGIMQNRAIASKVNSNDGAANVNSITNGHQHYTNNNSNDNDENINLTPNPNVGVIGSGLHHHNNSNNHNHQQQQQSLVTPFRNLGGLNILAMDLRARAGSLSSSGAASGSTSPSAISHSSIDCSISPIHYSPQQQQQLQLQMYQQQQQQLLPQVTHFNGNNLAFDIDIMKMFNSNGVLGVNGMGAGGANGVVRNLCAGKSLTPYDQQQFIQKLKYKEVEAYSERVRTTSGCNGIFSRRVDFSSFNLLPKTRLNSYQVKIEDEGNHGNDDTRLFILSSLAQSQMSRVNCILCECSMLVFDRYPLVDGSFFLSPKQHSPGCIEVKYEGRAMYLTCVCMACLDGTSPNRVISCRFCGEIWDGSNLVLGTMYAFDIFAAMPCCAERLKCNTCSNMLLQPQHRLNFYSDYSHCVTCPMCNTQDAHFVKPLSYCYTKNKAVRPSQIA